MMSRLFGGFKVVRRDILSATGYLQASVCMWDRFPAGYCGEFKMQLYSMVLFDPPLKCVDYLVCLVDTRYVELRLILVVAVQLPVAPD